jgi:hypothetical protein
MHDETNHLEDNMDNFHIVLLQLDLLIYNHNFDVYQNHLNLVEDKIE